MLYAKDPKRRLEVLWNNESARSDTQLIVITGQSTWTAPNGLKLGMPIAAVEKINKKPFNLRAFNGENAGYVTSAGTAARWPRSPAAARSPSCSRLTRRPKPAAGTPLDGNKEYPSGHPGMKAASPKIAEIILGY